MAKDGSRRIIVIASACALLFAPAAGAATKKPKPVRKPGPIVTKSQSVSVAPHVLATVTASCPGRMRAVGGGFHAAPGGEEPTQVTSSHLTSARSWSVSAIRSAPLTTSSGTVTATVNCRAAAPKLRTIAASVVMPTAASPGSVGTGTATARCPRKRRPIAGGFDTQVDTVTTLGVIPTESRKFKRRAWRASAVHSNTSPRTVTAFAYCARAGVSQKTDRVSMKGDLSTKSADARGCAPGEHPASGGFLTSGGSLTNGGNIVYVMESRLQGVAWRSTGLHAGPLSTGVLRSYLYCD